jgi:hypothetical protein
MEGMANTCAAGAVPESAQLQEAFTDALPAEEDVRRL